MGQPFSDSLTKTETRQATDGRRPSLLLPANELQERQWAIRSRLGDDAEVWSACLRRLELDLGASVKSTPRYVACRTWFGAVRSLL